MTSKSENVSEKARKRGRPSAFQAGEKGIVQHFFPDVNTERGRANICYQQRAIAALMNDPRFFWLGMDEAAVMAGKSRPRRAILQELGRIADEDTMRLVAEKVCELKPTARQARAMIRGFRGVQREGNALDLANILVGTVNAYLDSHRGMEWSEVQAAVRTLAAQIEKEATR